MSKIAKLEIAVIIILLICIGLYLTPYFKKSADERKIAGINANAAIFTSKSLAEFSRDKDQKASVVAKKTLDELNTVSKNPYDRKLPAYVSGNVFCGSVSIESDDKLQTITATGYGRDNVIIVRTVIKPPSFVTYKKYEEKK